MSRPALETCEMCGLLFPVADYGPIPTRCKACRAAAHNERTKRANRLRRNNAPRPAQISCGDCGRIVNLTGTVGGVPRFCVECRALRRRASLRGADRKHHLRSLYGLTEEQHAELVIRQDARCAICREQKPRLNVDHDHASGAIRGLLCSNCNTALGLLGEDVRTIYRAAAYLQRGGVRDAV